MQEGVIKYTHIKLNDSWRPQSQIFWNRLLYFRNRLFNAGLIGADPNRYGGYGFGNVSCRDGRGFIVSASQTSGREEVESKEFCRIVWVDFDNFSLDYAGQAEPSSEAITHLAVYDAVSAARFVFHTHDPYLWQKAAALNLPQIPDTVEYGTSQMADFFRQLRSESLTPPPNASLMCNEPGTHPTFIYAMEGHEDGIIGFSSCPGCLCERLIKLHKQATGA